MVAPTLYQSPENKRIIDGLVLLREGPFGKKRPSDTIAHRMREVFMAAHGYHDGIKGIVNSLLKIFILDVPTAPLINMSGSYHLSRCDAHDQLWGSTPVLRVRLGRMAAILAAFAELCRLSQTSPSVLPITMKTTFVVMHSLLGEIRRGTPGSLAGVACVHGFDPADW